MRESCGVITILVEVYRVAMCVNTCMDQAEGASGSEWWGQGSLGTAVLGKIANLSSSQALDESHKISDLWVCYVESEPYNHDSCFVSESL